ncbi:MAG: polyprenyl synthetase family protein [Syntrophales bacterium]|jgi:geranylgeranyl diphosphate synthase type II
MTCADRFDLEEYLQARKKIVDAALDSYLPPDDVYPPVIFQAIRYSLFSGGKRIRPILCLAAAETVGGSMEAIIPVACALEMIHTYSLIHDDLPAMDNDDFRRGRLTSHKVFGEAIAILAGDALLTEAFHILTSEDLRSNVHHGKLLDVIHGISEAAGVYGMVGGQVADIISEGAKPERAALEFIHQRKTGAMIGVSIKSAALLCCADERETAALTEYGRKIGLAFQIADDILNVEGDSRTMGKETGSDAQSGKLTYPALMGLEESRKKAASLVEQAIDALSLLDHRADPLRMIAEYVAARKS